MPRSYRLRIEESSCCADDTEGEQGEESDDLPEVDRREEGVHEDNFSGRVPRLA